MTIPIYYDNNSSNRTLLPLLDRWGLECRSIPLDTFYGHAHSSEVKPGEEKGNRGTGVEGEERQNGRKEQHVIIEGLSENIISSGHTIHMWEITKSQCHNVTEHRTQ